MFGEDERISQYSIESGWNLHPKTYWKIDFCIWIRTPDNWRRSKYIFPFNLFDCRCSSSIPSRKYFFFSNRHSLQQCIANMVWKCFTHIYFKSEILMWHMQLKWPVVSIMENGNTKSMFIGHLWFPFVVISHTIKPEFERRYVFNGFYSYKRTSYAIQWMKVSGDETNFVWIHVA